MHSAIGQVIDYGHRLDAGDRRVRLIIPLVVQGTGQHHQLGNRPRRSADRE
jgi:hypothetical protein